MNNKNNFIHKCLWIRKKVVSLQPERLKIEGMCKYNIAIDDAVMEEVRPSITSGMDENAWVQLQVEALFSRIAASRRKVSFDDEYMTNLINLSAPAWEGVKDADEWIHDLRGE